MEDQAQTTMCETQLTAEAPKLQQLLTALTKLRPM